MQLESGYTLSNGKCRYVIESVLGVEIGCASRKVITGLPVHFRNPEGGCKMDCVIVETDNKTGRAVSVENYSIS